MGEGGEKWESGEAVSGEVQVSEETIVAQQSSRLIGEEDGGRMHSLEKKPTNVPKLTNMALCRAETNVDLFVIQSFL